MISVLIPVYNYNVLALVTEINKQLIRQAIDFEIICIDDNSTKQIDENLQLTLFKNVQFIQLTTNIGRSKIRNLLAKKAIYNWLLFLDADVMPETDLFISLYLKEIESSTESVFCGGILYENKKPRKNQLLRWTYGKKREEIDCEFRQKSPHNFFLGANFLIQKKVFERVVFNEKIIKYGYEDTLFVEDLRINNINLKHVKNRVYHLGLENNDVFLKKTRVALQNLKILKDENFANVENIKVLKVFRSVKNTQSIFSFIWVKFNKNIENNLKSNNPSIYLFDMYKLSYFCYLHKQLTSK